MGAPFGRRAGIPAAGALFSFEGVRIAFGGASILSEVDLELPEGGCTVLIGPSGSGKTTLLRLCDRLDVPAAGLVRFRGDDISGARPAPPPPAGGDGVPARGGLRRHRARQPAGGSAGIDGR